MDRIPQGNQLNFRPAFFAINIFMILELNFLWLKIWLRSICKLHLIVEVQKKKCKICQI